MVAPSGRPQRCEKRSSPRTNEDARLAREPPAAEAEQGERHRLHPQRLGHGVPARRDGRLTAGGSTSTIDQVPRRDGRVQRASWPCVRLHDVIVSATSTEEESG